MQLSTWDKEELDEKLANRVQVSKRAVAKVIQAFDRLMQRNEKITLALKGELDGGYWNLLPSCDQCMLALLFYFLVLNVAIICSTLCLLLCMFFFVRHFVDYASHYYGIW